jgi:hypothetical protein
VEQRGKDVKITRARSIEIGTKIAAQVKKLPVSGDITNQDDIGSQIAMETKATADEASIISLCIERARNSSRICVPGSEAEQPCTCKHTGKKDGWLVCREDGQGYGSCQCVEPIPPPPPVVPPKPTAPQPKAPCVRLDDHGKCVECKWSAPFTLPKQKFFLESVCRNMPAGQAIEELVVDYSDIDFKNESPVPIWVELAFGASNDVGYGSRPLPTSVRNSRTVHHEGGDFSVAPRQERCTGPRGDAVCTGVYTETIRIE